VLFNVAMKVIGADKMIGQTKFFIALLLYGFMFFVGIGIAGLVHRPLYGGTVECNSFSASLALERQLHGSAEVISFFSSCEETHMEMIGFRHAMSGQKCCIPKPGRNLSFQCKGVSIVPDILNDPFLLTDETLRRTYARCCPTIAGNTVPVGFSAMAVGAVIGIVINFLLNILAVIVLPELKKKLCKPAEYTEEAAADECDGQRSLQSPFSRKVHRFLGICLQPSAVGAAKVLVALVVNIISAAAITSEDTGNDWSRYCTLVSAMFNGAFVGNLCDFICTVFVYQLAGFNESASAEDRDKNSVLDKLLQEYAAKISLAVFVLYLPLLITHWVTGLLAFLPWLAVFAIPPGIAFAGLFVTITQMNRRFQSSESAESMDINPVLVMGYAFAVFAICFVINIVLLQALRFPVNWAMMLYGATQYPYFLARPGVDSSAQLADFYAALFEVPFYFLQMSSQSCSLIKSADSALTQVSTAVMYV
jgi:hypothetical protein